MNERMPQEAGDAQTEAVFAALDAVVLAVDRLAGALERWRMRSTRTNKRLFNGE